MLFKNHIKLTFLQVKWFSIWLCLMELPKLPENTMPKHLEVLFSVVTVYRLNKTKMRKQYFSVSNVMLKNASNTTYI